MLKANWHRLPAQQLPTETRRQLTELMPGAASDLHRHEWLKHGTCRYRQHGDDQDTLDQNPAEEYCRDTLWVTRAINNSGVADYFAQRIGQKIDTRDIRRLFDRSFGAGAGKRVQFHCSGDGRLLLHGCMVA